MLAWGPPAISCCTTPGAREYRGPRAYIRPVRTVPGPGGGAFRGRPGFPCPRDMDRAGGRGPPQRALTPHACAARPGPGLSAARGALLSAPCGALLLGGSGRGFLLGWAAWPRAALPRFAASAGLPVVVLRRALSGGFDEGGCFGAGGCLGFGFGGFGVLECGEFRAGFATRVLSGLAAGVASGAAAGGFSGPRAPLFLGSAAGFGGRGPFLGGPGRCSAAAPGSAEAPVVGGVGRFFFGFAGLRFLRRGAVHSP